MSVKKESEIHLVEPSECVDFTLLVVREIGV